MRNTLHLEMPFYSPEGLKTVALLLDDLIDRRDAISQNALAEAIGIAPGTVKGVRSNRLNTDTVLYKPDPDTILGLAPHVIDPRSGRPFEPEALLQVARGQIQLAWVPDTRPSKAKRQRGRTSVDAVRENLDKLIQSVEPQIGWSDQ